MAMTTIDGIGEPAEPEVRGPRRAAMQGLAGLAAALGAAALTSEAAAGKKKRKRNRKHKNNNNKGKGGPNAPPSGVLLRVQVIDNFGSVGPLTTDDVDAECPAPGKNEVVFVLGGGISVVEADLVFLAAAADNATSPPIYTVSVHNTSDTKSHNFGSQAICGYFRK